MLIKGIGDNLFISRAPTNQYLPVVSLSCVQKGVSYSGVKFFNSLPSNIQGYRNDRKRLKKKLLRYLIIHSFYSITEFLECKIGKAIIKYKTTFMTNYLNSKCFYISYV